MMTRNNHRNVQKTTKLMQYWRIRHRVHCVLTTGIRLFRSSMVISYTTPSDDSTVIVNLGEHPFVSKETAIIYRRAKVLVLAKIREAMEMNFIFPPQNDTPPQPKGAFYSCPDMNGSFFFSKMVICCEWNLSTRLRILKNMERWHSLLTVVK